MVAASTEEIAGALTLSVAEDPVKGPAGHIRWCQLWLVDGDRITMASASGSSPRTGLRSVALSGRSAPARCVRGRRMVFGAPSSRDVACGETGDRPVPAGVIPIALPDRCLGALVVAYDDEDAIDDEERGFLAAVAEQAAQALDRAAGYAQQAETARVSSFLADSAQILSEAPGYADALERLATLALSVMGDICLIDVVDQDRGLERMVGRHRDPALQGLVDRLGHQYPPLTNVAHPAMAVIGAGHSSWSPHLTEQFLRQTSNDDEHYSLMKELRFRSYLSVPLLTAGEVIGALSLISSGRPFKAEDVAFAERLAHQVAAVVGNARRFDATLQTSHILQRSLLPQRLPDVDGLSIDSRYLPSSRWLEVGGDFYDALVLPSRRVGFMIGDVAGHNRDAAAAMGQLRAAARALSGQVHSPAELIAALQWSWDLLGFERIATALFGRLDPKSGELILASAGHHPPLLIESGRAEYLPVTPTTPLGAPETVANDWEGRLEPGQVLLLYTDGVVDQRSGRGMDRLAREAAAGEVHPAAVCERVIAMLPRRRLDDVALLALGRTG
jgi:serine/threonine-protein kinase RsbW